MPISNKASHLEQSKIFLEGGKPGTKTSVITCNVTTGTWGGEIYFHHKDCSYVLYAGLLMKFVARRRLGRDGLHDQLAALFLLFFPSTTFLQENNQ